MSQLVSSSFSRSAAPRAIVVGGGIAGLAAAWELARGGVAVTLLEGAQELGGRAATREEEGFSFNLGPHALYRKGHFKALLDAAGVSYHGGVAPTRGASGIYGGALVGMPSSPLAIVTSRFFGLRDKAQLLRFFARLRQFDLSALAGQSLAELLEREVASPKARAFAEGFFRVSTYANAPARLCAAAAVRQARLGLGGGVLYVAGGWGRLVQGLETALQRAGVHFEKGAKVAEVLTRDGAASGVALADGRSFAAELVVLAVRAQTACRLLPGEAGARLEQALQPAIPAAAACLDLALEKLPRPELLFALGFDQPTYFSVHSAATRVAPPGRVLLHAARYLAPGEERKRAEAQADLEAMLDLLQPGWGQYELHRQLLPRMVVQDSLPLAGVKRPGVDFAALPGLRLAGDWVDSEALLADAAAETGARAAAGLLAEAGFGQDARRRTA